MDKTAQQDDFVTMPIGSEQVIKGVWDKYFSGPHRNIVNNVRASFQKDPELQMKLVQAFPGYSWAEFADMPTNNSFEQIKSAIDKLLTTDAANDPGIKSAAEIYMATYNLMLKKLQDQHKKPEPKKETKPEEQKNEPTKAIEKKKRPAPSNKIKELQMHLGVEQTGMWNKQSNDAFLTWLKEKGWDKYIKNDRFTGNINDAISAMLIEKTPGKPVEEVSDFEQRQAHRLEILKKI